MRFVVFLFLIFIAFACANVMAPTGGPKDENPPKLLSTIPKQGQTNFHGSKIILEFNEFLKLKNPKDEIIVTPNIKEINYSVKKNIFSIDLGEKLLDSTTYSFSFRESIQDLNEGNPAEDLHLAFSTGNEIDSLEISGQVIQLLRGQPAEKYTIAIYQSDTFDIFKHRPSYFSRTNKNGEFKIRNLKAGDYAVYAFEDKNKNLILESKTEKFGILKDRIKVNDNVDSIAIKTILLDSRPISVTGIRALGHFTKVRLNKNIVTYKIESQDSSDSYIPNCFSSSNSEIDIYPNKPVNDSTLIKLTGIDSLNQSLDTLFYVKQTSAKSLKEKIKVAINSSLFTQDEQRFATELKSSELIRNTNPDSIYIQIDSTTIFPFDKTNISIDTIFRTITIKKTFERKDSIDWKTANLILGASSFTSIHGDSTRKSSTKITLISPEETAILIIESNETHPNILIEVLDNRLTPIAIQSHTKSLVFKNLKPGSVTLRRIMDANGNGKWDPGNPNKGILPEDIQFYINADGKFEIPLRANWEVPIKWNF